MNVTKQQPFALVGELVLGVLLLIQLMPVATLRKPVRRGWSTWDFIRVDETKCFARKTTGRVIKCRDIDDMRQLYRRMVGYGYEVA